MATSPFLRGTADKTLQALAKKEDPASDGSPVAVLAVMRRMKDKF